MIQVEHVIEETRRRRKMPTRMEIEHREQTVLDMLARSPAINAGDVRRELDLNSDAANHLFKMMEKAGKIERHGVSAGTTWTLPGTVLAQDRGVDPATALRHRVDAPMPERSGMSNGDLQGRYVALLIERRPDRLITLIEKGRLELTDEVLDAVEAVVFNERG